MSEKKLIKIWIVEDEEPYQDILKEVLSSDVRIKMYGEFTSGEDFLKFLNSPFRADVCLIDIKLKGKLSGLDCAKKVKEIDPGIHVILITAYPTPQILIEAKQIQADLIEKGSVGESLIDKIVTSVKKEDSHFFSLKHDLKDNNKDYIYILAEEIEKSRSRIEDLTDKQKKVLKLKQHGKTYKEIAQVLDMNEHTVRSHIERALKKLDLPNVLKFLKIE